MSNLEELPGQIAGEVQNAIENQAQDRSAEMHEAEIKLERERIKAEERINERLAERDERIAQMQSEAEQYRSMLDEMFSRFSQLLSSNTPVIEVDATHEQNQIPASTEDEPENGDENDETSPEITAEGIEEIGGNPEENSTPPTEPSESVNDNANPGKSGRRKKRRSR